MESRDEARAFPQLLENADEAGVSHTSHSLRYYKKMTSLQCPRCLRLLSSMSPFVHPARGEKGTRLLCIARRAVPSLGMTQI